jgi:hypothetical protein
MTCCWGWCAIRHCDWWWELVPPFCPRNKWQGIEWHHMASPKKNCTFSWQSYGCCGMHNAYWLIFLLKRSLQCSDAWTAMCALWKAPNERRLSSTTQPHVAHLTSEATAKNDWEMLLCPPCSLDLASSDHHLFCVFEDHMRGNTVQEAMHNLLWSSGMDFCHSGIFKLVLAKMWIFPGIL